MPNQNPSSSRDSKHYKELSATAAILGALLLCSALLTAVFGQGVVGQRTLSHGSLDAPAQAYQASDSMEFDFRRHHLSLSDIWEGKAQITVTPTGIKREGTGTSAADITFALGSLVGRTGADISASSNFSTHLYIELVRATAPDPSLTAEKRPVVVNQEIIRALQAKAFKTNPADLKAGYVFPQLRPVLDGSKTLAKGDKGKDVTTIVMLLRETGHLARATLLTDTFNDDIDAAVQNASAAYLGKPSQVVGKELAASLVADYQSMLSAHWINSGGGQ